MDSEFSSEAKQVHSRRQGSLGLRVQALDQLRRMLFGSLSPHILCYIVLDDPGVKVRVFISHSIDPLESLVKEGGVV